MASEHQVYMAYSNKKILENEKGSDGEKIKKQDGINSKIQ